MDLASGCVPVSQRVDLERRNKRYKQQWLNGQPSPRQIDMTRAGSESFTPHRRQVKPQDLRLDRHYARDTMGHLSDPDVVWSMS